MRQLTLPLLLGLALSGCGGGDTTGPQQKAPDPREAIVGMWEMVAVNGQPFPFVEYDRGHSRSEIVGGTMRFAPGPHGSALQTCSRSYDRDFPAGALSQHTDDFGWDVSGNVVTVNFIYPSHIRTDVATLKGGELVLQRTFEEPDRNYHFRKVADKAVPFSGCR